jgi:two-component system, chemotaxis family, CheB/CheR fusion protein
VVGQHLMNLDIGLPLDGLYPVARRVLAGAEVQAHMDIPAVNRRGRPLTAATTVAPLADGAGGCAGVILFITEKPGAPSA